MQNKHRVASVLQQCEKQESSSRKNMMGRNYSCQQFNVASCHRHSEFCDYSKEPHSPENHLTQQMSQPSFLFCQATGLAVLITLRLSCQGEKSRVCKTANIRCEVWQLQCLHPFHHSILHFKKQQVLLTRAFLSSISIFSKERPGPSPASGLVGQQSLILSILLQAISPVFFTL